MMVPPLHWTWRDLGRAFKAAWWAFYHADDLTMLKHALEEPGQFNEPPAVYRHRQWLAFRFLARLPIK